MQGFIDTHLLINNLLSPNPATSATGLIFAAALREAFTLLLIAGIPSELNRKLRDDTSLARRLPRADADELILLLESVAENIPPLPESYPEIGRDRKDDYLIADAVVAQADACAALPLAAFMQGATSFVIFQSLAGKGPMQLVFPSSMPDVAPSLSLMKAEKAEFEAVFGTEFVFVDEDPGSGPRWLLEIEPGSEHNTLAWDREALTLTSHAKDASGFMTTLNLLHSLVGLGVERIIDAPAASTADAVERVYREIAGTFPGFGIRGLDWDEITARHVHGDGAEMTFAGFQRWIAELGDAHTAIRRPVPVYNPPYAVELTSDAATIRHVPEWSGAWQAGVRTGWVLDIDHRDDWLARTGAAPHAKALTAGRRAIALEGVDSRSFTATSPDGATVPWTERATAPSLDHAFGTRHLDDRTGYLHPGNWFTGIGFEEAFDEAFARFRGLDRLVLDLQGNTGGNLMLAIGMRNRFLRERTLLGTIRFSTGGGTLADPVQLWADPEPEGARWEGNLIVLTDALTYSASEDFLLGLQGLPHVTVVGQRSGGGSGRPRTIRITDEMNLVVSTALTYDRNGTCIENHGIPVDVPCEVFVADGRNIALEQALAI